MHAQNRSGGHASPSNRQERPIDLTTERHCMQYTCCGPISMNTSHCSDRVAATVSLCPSNLDEEGGVPRTAKVPLAADHAEQAQRQQPAHANKSTDAQPMLRTARTARRSQTIVNEAQLSAAHTAALTRRKKSDSTALFFACTESLPQSLSTNDRRAPPRLPEQPRCLCLRGR